MQILEQFTKSNGKIYATLYYDEELNAIVDVWEGYYGSVENFNRVLSRVVNFLEEHNWPNWLADLRKLDGPFISSSEFIVKKIAPRVERSGLKREAIVLSENIFAGTSIIDTSEKVTTYELRLFDSINEARRWLLNHT